MFKNIITLTAGFIILVTIQFCSNIILQFFNIPFPSPLLGMMFLVLFIKFKIIPEHLIKDICELLLNNMTLFFVPLLVGVMIYFDVIHKNLVPILATVFISTFATMILTAIFVETMIKHIRRLKISAISDMSGRNQHD